MFPQFFKRLDCILLHFYGHAKLQIDTEDHNAQFYMDERPLARRRVGSEETSL